MGEKIFISYTEADLAIAEWVAWELQAAGSEVVIQAWHFRPGEDFLAWMHREVEAADHVVAGGTPRRPPRACPRGAPGCPG